MSPRSRSRIAVLVTVLALSILISGIAASPAMAAKKPSRHRHKRPSQTYQMKQVIRQVARQEFHLGNPDVKALIVLAKRESDYNPRCVTGSYKGLFQLDNHSKHVWEPKWNTGVAIKEMKRTYGSPRKALEHSYAFGWW